MFMCIEWKKQNWHSNNLILTDKTIPWNVTLQQGDSTAGQSCPRAGHLEKERVLGEQGVLPWVPLAVGRNYRRKALSTHMASAASCCPWLHPVTTGAPSSQVSWEQVLFFLILWPGPSTSVPVGIICHLRPAVASPSPVVILGFLPPPPPSQRVQPDDER